MITAASLSGDGKTTFGSNATITGGVAAGIINVTGLLTANVTGGTVSVGTLTGNLSGGNVTVTGLLTGNVTSGAGTISAGSMTGNVGSSVTVTGLLTGNITAGTNSFGSLSSTTVSGGTNTVTGSAAIATISGGTNALGGDATITTFNSTSGSTTVTGVATITTLTDGTINLNGATSSITTLNGGTIALGSTALTVSNGSYAGGLSGSNGSLIKNSSGTLTLLGANTYAGATTVSAGVLAISHATALGSDAAGTTVADGAELRVLGGITVATEALTLNGSGVSTNGALRNFSGDNTVASAIALASAARIVSTAGTLTLTGGVTGADKNLTFGGNGNTTISSTGLSLGTGSLTKTGTGLLLLSVANTYSGGTTISGGSIKIGVTDALGSGAVNVGGVGTLDLNNLTISNAIVLADGATLTGGSLPATSVPTSGKLDIIITGSSDLEKNDSGRLELTAASTYTGATKAAGGTVAVSDFGNGSSASPLGVTALTDPSKLVLSAGATLEFTGTTATSTARSFTVSGSAGIAAGTGAAALTFTEDAKIALSGATPELKLIANNSGTNVFRASLSDDDITAGRGLKTLTIDGAGVWVIGGNVNRFKQDIRVDVAGGTIALESGALPATAVIAISDGAKLRWEAGNTNDLSSNLSITAGATAKLDLGNNNVVFNAAPTVATGSGSTVTIEKQGSGSLKIATGVNAGTVNVSLPANSGLLTVNGSVGNVSLGTGSTLGGSGTVGNVTAGSGAVISPGNSPGTLGGTTIRMDGGSIYEWQVQDAKETTINPGYDKLALSGNLDLTNASAGNRVTLKVISLAGNGNGTTPGNPLNFDAPAGASSIRVFNFATVGGTVLLNSGANISDVFTINVDQFTYTDGSSSNAGLWSINWNSGSGLITVTAVPEPSTYGLGLGALALAAAAIRRRKLKAKAQA